MRMNLVLEIKDVPGQLVSVLSPIGDLGANLVAIIHQRDVKNEKGLIPVQITIEGERENLNAVVDKFDEMGIKYKYSEYSGGHSWPVWRHDLFMYAPLLFK